LDRSAKYERRSQFGTRLDKSTCLRDSAIFVQRLDAELAAVIVMNNTSSRKFE
jgi:hypothetical protein